MRKSYVCETCINEPSTGVGFMCETFKIICQMQSYLSGQMCRQGNKYHLSVSSCMVLIIHLREDCSYFQHLFLLLFLAAQFVIGWSRSNLFSVMFIFRLLHFALLCWSLTLLRSDCHMVFDTKIWRMKHQLWTGTHIWPEISKSRSCWRSRIAW